MEYYKSIKATAFSEKASLGERWQALQEMGQHDIEWFRKDLERALVAKEWFVRNAALVSIQKGKREFVIQWSKKLLADPALVVRTQAVKNLMALRAVEASDSMLEALRSKKNFRGSYSLWIRPHLAQALAMNPPKDWQGCYRYMLNDVDPKVQFWAIVGLENKSGLRLGQKDDSLESKKKKWQNFFGIRMI